MNEPRPSLDAQITFCYTTRFDECIRFYGDLLGLPLALDQGACRIYRTGAGAFLGVCRRRRAPSTDGVIITLVSDDVDGWYAHLAARGVVFEKAPAYNAEFRIYHCFLRDPSGYLVEIQRFEDTAWTATAASR